MTVSQIIKGIILRCGKDVMALGEPFILSTMNQIYQELNEEYKAIEKQDTFSFSAADIAASINYKEIPSDCIRIFRLNPFYEWRDPTVFRNDEYYCWTILGDEGTRYAYFTEMSEATDIEYAYYSTGKTLVNKTTGLATTEVNEPEWPPRFHRLLMFEVAVELKSDYPLRATDIAKMQDLRSKLARYNFHRQEASPIREGEQARNLTDETTDPYL